MATSLGVSRTVVVSCLRDMGLRPRTGREANLIRMAALTPGERRALARAANEKVRNTGRQEEVRHRAAVTRQRNRSHVGRFEPEVAEHLEAHGLELVPQYAWRRYNLDFFIPARRVAVEIHCSGLRPVFINTAAQKTMELLCAGISLAECWIQTSRSETASPTMLEQLVAFIDVARPLPSGLGEYRVIRGRGDVDPISQSYLDDMADVAVRYRRLQSGGVE